MINPNEKYFLASTRFAEDKPEDYGLKSVDGEEYFLDKNDNRWVAEKMWDKGWGNENGYVRLPLLTVDELWELLTKSDIQENIRGSAEFLERRFPDELKSKLTALFSSKGKLDRKLSKRLSNLQGLKSGANSSGILGKSYDEIKKDAEDWKNLKDSYESLKTDGIWGKLFGKS